MSNPAFRLLSTSNIPANSLLAITNATSGKIRGKCFFLGVKAPVYQVLNVCATNVNTLMIFITFYILYFENSCQVGCTDCRFFTYRTAEVATAARFARSLKLVYCFQLRPKRYW